MEWLDESADVIAHDCISCLRGMQNGDPHLLEVNRSRLDHYFSILSQVLQQAVDDSLRELISQAVNLLRQLSAAADFHLSRLQISEQVGDDKVEITTDLVVELRKMGMPWSKIAAFFKISRQSMYIFRQKYNIEEPNEEISEDELQSLISELTAAFPRAGAVYIKGALTSMGFSVTWQRVKNHLRQASPSGTLLRRRQKIHRRKYKVKGSNYLWCIDSNHKLIHFRIVIHGCIDGFSRKIIYLNAATNNRADTVVNMFREGLSRNGIPKRVRADKGSENVRVKDCMQELRPEISCPFIEGRSVHNVRIERLWRETNSHPTWKFKQIFKHLERIEILSEHSELDLLCLSYVYLPRIQKELETFTEIWNNHAMRTMNGRSPLQIWTLNMMQQSQQSHENPDLFDGHDFLINNEDGDAAATDSDDDNSIHVPRFSPELVEAVLPNLFEILPDPLVDDGNHGINNYILVRNHAYGLFQS